MGTATTGQVQHHNLPWPHQGCLPRVYPTPEELRMGAGCNHALCLCSFPAFTLAAEAGNRGYTARRPAPEFVDSFEGNNVTVQTWNWFCPYALGHILTNASCSPLRTSEGSFCPNPANTYWMLNITQRRNACKANGIASGIANIYAYNQMCNLGLSTLSYSWPMFKRKKKKKD